MSEIGASASGNPSTQVAVSTPTSPTPVGRTTTYVVPAYDVHQVLGQISQAMFPMGGPPPGQPFPGPQVIHITPGGPNGPLIPHPLLGPHQPRAPPPPPQRERNDDADSEDNKLLRQILLGVSKMAKAIKANDQALRDITSRQGSIEDRLSLMEQRSKRN